MIGIGMEVFNMTMTFEEFSKIMATFDTLLNDLENGKDIFPLLVTIKIAYKHQYPEFTERLK